MNFPALEWSGTNFCLNYFLKIGFLFQTTLKKIQQNQFFSYLKKKLGAKFFSPESTHYTSRYPENLVGIELLCNL